MSLLRKALEGELETPPTTVAEPAAPAPTEGNQPNNTEAAVVMTGPLGQVYTQALAIAFAKPEVNERVETTDVTAMESQANDAIMAAGAIHAVTGADADVIDNPEALIYGVSAQKLDEQTVIDVAKQMAEFELEQPEEFIVVVDATDMAQNADNQVNDPTEQLDNAATYLTQPVNDANLEKVELLPVLESMVVAMGGRVVYSLKQALECITELRTEVVEEIEIETPAGDPVAEPGASVSEPAAPVGEIDPPKETTAPEEKTETGVEEVKEVTPKVEELPVPEVIAPAGSDVSEPADSTAVELSMESDKGKKKDEKKKEAPSSKLKRAKNLISAVIPKIKESALRAELHHAVGIILSAVKDVK